MPSRDIEKYSPKANNDNYGWSNDIRPLIIVKLGGYEGTNLSEDQNRTLEQEKKGLRKLYRNAWPGDAEAGTTPLVSEAREFSPSRRSLRRRRWQVSETMYQDAARCARVSCLRLSGR